MSKHRLIIISRVTTIQRLPSKNRIWRNMRIHTLAKTEFSTKQQKKWMSGIQMDVEDAEENGVDFHYYFCGWNFLNQILGSALLFLCQLYFFISSWERTRQRPPDDLPEHAPLGWAAFVRSISGAYVSDQKYLWKFLNAVIIQLAEAH